MKKPDLIKQLANRINQPHVIEIWINKIEKAAYNKGCKDTESKQFVIPVVVEQCKHEYDHYTNTHGETVAVCSKCMNSYF